ncbi:MAG: Cell division protein FtsK/SpoIIIE [candidate division WWE3 bacterium GW2011_GWC2_44_9]|uniref:Cell division protein FtsK/SpoIIIE n=1 Tax=candidate division WWE3 bacterium GW2011_GWC2_44_9 TaxID=1619125 RepID=A0A0G1KH96_UNCKA|nr:MAG: Cell division protein FtsK/SpoIIIE [candidate division WWE3 bacterium GW2011_GWC2_44_9]
MIKANIPCRVAFNVTSQVDSRVIIDQAGAEKLIGRGDMLFVPPDASKPTRIQGAYIGDGEISKLVDWLKSTGFAPEYKEDVLDTPDDDLYDRAVEAVVSAGKASVSFLQRRLSVGYARAARIMDQLEETKVVSPPDSNRERQVLTGASRTNDGLDFVDNQLDQ